MEQSEFAICSCLVSRSSEGLLAELLQWKGPARQSNSHWICQNWSSKVYGFHSWLYWLLELTRHWSMEPILLLYGNRIKLWGEKSPTILLPFLINICVYEKELGKQLVIHEKLLSVRACITLKTVICLAECVRYTDFPPVNLFPCPSFGSW